jgi:hypothetical protein
MYVDEDGHEHVGPPAPKPDYPEVDLRIPENSYNCAGLAFRDYKKNLDVSGVKKRLAEGCKPVPCENACATCQEKCMLWIYDVETHLLMPSENTPSPKIRPYSTYQDYHIVCGESSGANDIYPKTCSKNGEAPIVRDKNGQIMLRTLDKWKPVERSAIINGNLLKGWKRVQKFKNMTTTCYCCDWKRLSNVSGE